MPSSAMRTLFLGLFAGQLGCGEAAPPGPVDCASMAAGGARDRCLHEELKDLGGDQAAAVLQKARLIDDPMIRGAAVSRWVSEHSAVVAPAEGQALCELLTGGDRSHCLRRLSSPHLQR